MRSLIAVTVATVFAAAAHDAAAVVNLEHGRAYEETFLLACSARHPDAECQCLLEAVETELGFDTFAEAIVRHGAGFLDMIPPTALDRARRSRRPSRLR